MNCGIRNAERGIKQSLTRRARRFRLCQSFSDLEVPRLRLRRTRATPGNVSLLTEVSSPRTALRFRASDGALGPKGRGNLAQALAWVAYFIGARSEGPSEARNLRVVRARDRNFCWGTMASFIAVLETSHAQTHKTQAKAWARRSSKTTFALRASARPPRVGRAIAKRRRSEGGILTSDFADFVR
jgi:hypothetical protein